MIKTTVVIYYPNETIDINIPNFEHYGIMNTVIYSNYIIISIIITRRNKYSSKIKITILKSITVGFSGKKNLILFYEWDEIDEKYTVI